MINLEQLKQFSVVSEHLNFTKAANYLFISHSTISRNMTSLEDSLGTQLFIRNNRSVSLTAAGELLAERVRQLFQFVDAMERDVQRAGLRSKGTLSIASLNMYNSELFKCYSYFSQEWPDIEMVIYHKSASEIISMVSCGDADIGIIFSFAPELDPGKFDMFPFQTGEFRLLVSQEHPLAKLESVDIRDKRLTDAITLAQMDYDFVREIGGKTVSSISPGKVAPNLESLFLQVKAGMGIALLPQHAATEAGSGCTQVRLTGADTSYKVIMFRLKTNHNPAIRLFQETYTKLSGSAL